MSIIWYLAISRRYTMLWAGSCWVHNIRIGEYHELLLYTDRDIPILVQYYTRSIMVSIDYVQHTTWMQYYNLQVCRRIVLWPSQYFAFYGHTCFSMFWRPRVLLCYVEKKMLNKCCNPSNDHYNESQKIRNLERDSSVRLNSSLFFFFIFRDK